MGNLIAEIFPDVLGKLRKFETTQNYGLSMLSLAGFPGGNHCDRLVEAHCNAAARRLLHAGGRRPAFVTGCARLGTGAAATSLVPRKYVP